MRLATGGFKSAICLIASARLSSVYILEAGRDSNTTYHACAPPGGGGYNGLVPSFTTRLALVKVEGTIPGSVLIKISPCPRSQKSATTTSRTLMNKLFVQDIIVLSLGMVELDYRTWTARD